ncbi:MAG: bifunctional oligoribonuclease/PAP phosphatase NrnA [Flavobacteriaceae bacterium]|nr:bifunctional oligoribonuclease/PAP phosphatase NrnA [Flavobacteriaceae bacterium]
MMNKTILSELKKLLEKPQKIVLVPHRNPDGDAIGSCLAMYHYLTEKGHSCEVVSPNPLPDFLKWLPSAEIITIFEKNTIEATEKIEQADVVFLLDFNAFHRTGNEMQTALENYKGTFIMIDHHQEPDPITKYTYSDTSICATCEMVYHFLEKLEDTKAITPTIATCLYTGIMTDTGSFKFASTTATTHRVVADLMDKGAKGSDIQEAVFNNNSYNRLQLLGRALSNMKVLKKYRTAYITLSQKELNKFKYQKGDTEGVVNYALSLKGVIFAVIFIEDKEQNIIKMSLRSEGDFSVSEFARNHFNGGGHHNASGARSELTLSETVEKFIGLLPKYEEELRMQN